MIFTGTETWTYQGANEISMDGDLTDSYCVNMKVKIVQGASTKYFKAVSVTYSAPNTIIELDGYGVYTVADAAIDSHKVSMLEEPQGWPATMPKEVFRTSGTSTGTGSPQTIAHGLEDTPKRVLAYPTEDPASTVFSWGTPGADATNIYLTVTSGMDFTWIAEYW